MALDSVLEPSRFPSGKASALREEDTGIAPSVPWWSHASDLQIGSLIALLEVLGVIESVLGQVGLESVYCVWIR